LVPFKPLASKKRGGQNAVFAEKGALAGKESQNISDLKDKEKKKTIRRKR